MRCRLPKSWTRKGLASDIDISAYLPMYVVSMYIVCADAVGVGFKKSNLKKVCKQMACSGGGGSDLSPIRVPGGPAYPGNKPLVNGRLVECNDRQGT